MVYQQDPSVFFPKGHSCINHPTFFRFWMAPPEPSFATWKHSRRGPSGCDLVGEVGEWCDRSSPLLITVWILHPTYPRNSKTRMVLINIWLMILPNWGWGNDPPCGNLTGMTLGVLNTADVSMTLNFSLIRRLAKNSSENYRPKPIPFAGSWFGLVLTCSDEFVWKWYLKSTGWWVDDHFSSWKYLQIAGIPQFLTNLFISTFVCICVYHIELVTYLCPH